MVPLAKYETSISARVRLMAKACVTIQDDLWPHGITGMASLDGSLVEGEFAVDPDKKQWDYADFEDRLPRVAIVIAEGGRLEEGRRWVPSLGEFYAAWQEEGYWCGGLFRTSTSGGLVKVSWECKGCDALKAGLLQVAGMIVRHLTGASVVKQPIPYFATSYEAAAAHERACKKYGEYGVGWGPRLTRGA
jgi:hypothetical protein